MLPEGSIAAEHIWKRFRADRRRMLLRDELERIREGWRDRSRARWRWALRDVSLEARPGESIGLVGVNGSGKSTLLKILTRVMYPYAGRIHVSGRVGALIEVAEGIHPDLTGGENVYLYGSLLGLGRREVARRFDDIVGFAQLEDAIDRQVKYYSTGMQMRLGFGVAAFLEPAVLLVDEALAVGDAAFQRRCIDRMRSVIAQGTTLVFVSHDLLAIKEICTRGIWLQDGSISADGPVDVVLDAYTGWLNTSMQATVSAAPVRLTRAEVVGSNAPAARSQEPCEVRIIIESVAARSGSMFLGLSEGPALPILLLRRDLELRPGENEALCQIPELPFPSGNYYLWVGFFDERGGDLLGWHCAADFEVVGDQGDGRRARAAIPGGRIVDWEVLRR